MEHLQGPGLTRSTFKSLRQIEVFEQTERALIPGGGRLSGYVVPPPSILQVGPLGLAEGYA